MMGDDNNVYSKVNKKGILYIFQFQLNFMICCSSYGDKYIPCYWLTNECKDEYPPVSQ